MEKNLLSIQSLFTFIIVLKLYIEHFFYFWMLCSFKFELVIIIYYLNTINNYPITIKIDLKFSPRILPVFLWSTVVTPYTESH